MDEKKKVPLCKECRWFTPIAGTKKNGFCHKGEIRERIVRAYDGQPKTCRRIGGSENAISGSRLNSEFRLLGGEDKNDKR